MNTIADLFAAAVQYQMTGDLGNAEMVCRQIVQANPNHADTHYLLGVLALQTGRCEQAATSLHQAVALRPEVAPYHLSLGLAYQALSQTDNALKHFQEALRLQPDLPEAHINVGSALLALGKREDAAAHYREAIRLKPTFAEAYCGLGAVSADKLHWAEAAEHFREALRIRPSFAEAHCNLANALKCLGKLNEAVACCREALRLRPDWPEAYDLLGNTLLSQGKPQDAITNFHHALRLRPDFAEAHNNLGNALQDQGKMDEAGKHFQEALRIRPDLPEAHSSLGSALYAQGRFQEALPCFDKALQLRPGFPQAHKGRALLRLLSGDFANGWPDFESRWAEPGFVKRQFVQPLWDGSDLGGRTILLHAEHGLGDTIQFIRYANLVKQRGGNVIVECQLSLLQLLANTEGIDHLVARGESLPEFKTQAPLLSLPGIFRTDLGNVPVNVPYLQADAELVERWRLELINSAIRHRASDTKRTLKIGIAWQGNPAYYYDRQRSIPLDQFAKLARVDGVEFISLQKGAGTDQLHTLRDRFPLLDLRSRLDESAGAFMDTAAIMNNLDLVISSDTAIPHLAGALGIPVWVALPWVPDWRWLLEREDSPWYPSMRLFRQTRQGDWNDVFERMSEALSKMNNR
jgi:tetratricopeptide (TPR) repeat protein